jgi:tRNA1(Val) A37 N6-methylase TrmN6
VQYKLEAKKLLLLRHRADGPVSLILMQFRKGGKPGLIWQEESLAAPDGTKTDYYRYLYHI